MKEQEKVLLLYQSIESNDADCFLSIIENHDLKWLNSFITTPEIAYLYELTFPLQLAIEVGNERIVAKLLEMGENPDPFFEYAIIAGNRTIVKLLIDAGFEIQADNNELLCRAAECENIEIVKLLIERGVDINGYDDDDFLIHPLVKSIVNGHIHIYEYLLNLTQKQREILNTIALQEIARVGNLKALNFLLIDQNIDVNSTHYLWGSTALITAVGANQLNIVDYLINIGANVNLQDLWGVTALMTAVSDGSMTLVKKLLVAGASKDLKDNNGNTALDLAINRKDKVIAKLLESN